MTTRRKLTGWILALVILVITQPLTKQLAYWLAPLGVMLCAFAGLMVPLNGWLHRFFSGRQRHWVGTTIVAALWLIYLFGVIFPPIPVVSRPWSVISQLFYDNINLVGFYRLFAPAYQRLDFLMPWLDVGILLVSLGLCGLVAWRLYRYGLRIYDLGPRVAFYLPLALFMSIFLGELLGSPAGVGSAAYQGLIDPNAGHTLIGAESNFTTRDNLLSANWVAHLFTWNRLTLFAVMYIGFFYLPFWLTALIGGGLWIFYKQVILGILPPGLLLDQYPGLPLPWVLWLFLTGIRYTALPMALLLLGECRGRLTVVIRSRYSRQ